MLNLRPEHQKRLEQLAKGRAAPSSPPPSSSNGPANLPAPSSDAPGAAGEACLLARMQGTDLLKLLGLKNVCYHIDSILLFFLIGWAYHQGARSGRRIAALLADPPPALLADDLAVRVRDSLEGSTAPFRAIRKLAKLFTDHLQTDVPLVTYVGEGEAFSGLTEAGEQFWRLVADYLRKYL